MPPDGRKGTIVGASTGRALTYADTPGWLNAITALNGPDAPLPDDVVKGMVAVLTRWRQSWNARPVAVVPMPSRRHPVLVHDLAERIAAIGKLELVDALTVSGPRPPDDVPSGPRVEALFASSRGQRRAQPFPTDRCCSSTTPTALDGR